MVQGADYSGGRPTGAQLKTAGFAFVIRYIGLGSAGKRLTKAEYANLVAEGVVVLLVAELGTGDTWGTSTDDDYGRGVANAKAALADARACGVPEDKIFIFAASDAHAPAQWAINDTVRYVTGFRDVLGVARTGHYGFSETNVAVHNAGVASGFWRCGSKPSTLDQGWVNFWQRNVAPTTKVVAGVVCDINDQYHAINPEDTDMPLTDADAQLVAKHIWYDWIWSQNNGATGQNASQVLATLNTQLTGLTAALAAQTKLIVDNEANDVTPENLAAALKGLITSELAPVVHDAVAEALGTDNAEQAAATASAILQTIGAIFAKNGGTLAPTTH
jgi:hypothetical protein